MENKNGHRQDQVSCVKSKGHQNRNHAFGFDLRKKNNQNPSKKTNKQIHNVIQSVA